jgi:formylglycine-generating enzyme required for sulfatase activity
MPALPSMDGFPGAPPPSALKAIALPPELSRLAQLHAYKRLEDAGVETLRRAAEAHWTEVFVDPAPRTEADPKLAPDAENDNPPLFTFSGISLFVCGSREYWIASYTHNRSGLVFSLIPAGAYVRGSPKSEPNRAADEHPHLVRLARPFLMAQTEVSQRAWEAVAGPGTHVSANPGDDLPVERITWSEAADWCALAGLQLPTEGQWEWAARAGTTTQWSVGDDPFLLTEAAVVRVGVPESTLTVGLRPPNAFGLFDIHGNVSEWCWDWYGQYPMEEPDDPVGPSTGSTRVHRGGSWNAGIRAARSAMRGWAHPHRRWNDIGLRPVYTLR